MMKDGDKLIILSFDTESNIGSWTQDYSSIDLAMPKILHLLSEKQIKATFVWEGKAALHNSQMLRTVFDHGHECGCHSYQHESVGKPSYFIPGDRAILPEEVSIRLRKNYDIVKSIIGEPPVSFRAPRLWGDEVVINELEKLGFLCDSTYAMSRPGDSLFPYHPSRNDIARAGDLKLLELPVAGIFGDMLADTAGNVPQWPILRMHGAKAFMDYLRPLINKQLEQRNYSIITIYQHPWEFIEMPSIIECPEGISYLAKTLYENCGDYALVELEKFIDLFKAEGFKFVTMKELYTLYEAGLC
jgi:peptidoglycan-N-acetylglucosamine deacetylase